MTITAHGIIGFSGGKDNTMLLQLVWNALKPIDPMFKNMRQIYVVCNNTLVENPKILEFTERTLNAIQIAAVKDGLNILVERTTPKLEDTFWLNLIGRGYPAPNSLFRWCTERLKINPTTKFILEKINEAGEAIIHWVQDQMKVATVLTPLKNMEYLGNVCVKMFCRMLLFIDKRCIN